MHFNFSIGNISSWVSDLYSTNSVETNTKYYYKLIFTGSSYEVWLSKNGIDYVKEMETQSTAKIPYSSSYNIIFGISRTLATNDANWLGTMDLSKFKIIADGVTVFSGSKVALPSSGGSVDAYTKTETDELLTGKQDKLIASTGISLTKVGEVAQTPYKMTGQGIWSNASSDIQISGTDSASSTTYGSRPVYKIYEAQDLFNNDWQFTVIYNTGSSSNNCFGAGLEFNIDNAAYNTQITRTLFSQADKSTTYVKLYCGSSTYTVTLPEGYTQVEVLMKHTTGNKTIKFYAKEVSQDSYQYLGSSEILNSSDISATIYMGNTYAPTSTQNNGRTTCSYNNIKLLNPYSEKTAYNISAITATSSNLGIVKPDGTSITVNEAGVISGQDVKTFTGYSDTGTLVLKSINGVLQWVAEG